VVFWCRFFQNFYKYEPEALMKFFQVPYLLSIREPAYKKSPETFPSHSYLSPPQAPTSSHHLREPKIFLSPTQYFYRSLVWVSKESLLTPLTAPPSEPWNFSKPHTSLSLKIPFLWERSGNFSSLYGKRPWNFSISHTSSILETPLRVIPKLFCSTLPRPPQRGLTHERDPEMVPIFKPWFRFFVTFFRVAFYRIFTCITQTEDM
jgi:hypothetical protein